MERILVPVDRRDRNAEACPDAVVVHARGHHVDQHLVLADRPGRHHLELERAFRRPVALLADRPGVHLLGARGRAAGFRRCRKGLLRRRLPRGFGRIELHDGRHAHNSDCLLAGQPIERAILAIQVCASSFCMAIRFMSHCKITPDAPINFGYSVVCIAKCPFHPAAGALGPRRTKMRDKAQRDKPWIFRTYAGHSTARNSNALYRKNLAKGQTGLSVAFDLPTQTGYDSDHVLAQGRGRQGRRAGRRISATCARCSTKFRSPR